MNESEILTEEYTELSKYFRSITVQYFVQFVELYSISKILGKSVPYFDMAHSFLIYEPSFCLFDIKKSSDLQNS